MKEVYLDYAATTPVKKEVLDEMLPYFTENYGNPSSLYSIAYKSKEAITLARKRVADLIGATEKEIFFTSGGTEADNWAVLGTARSRQDKGKHIITTKIEHHALIHTAQSLEKEGFKVTYLDVDQEGNISLDQLKESITDETTLISIIFANNEIGTIQPIKEIAKIAKENNIVFHSDAVQALGNVPIDVKDLGVDMLSFSAHKIYGPKGVGALYIRRGLKIDNFIHGGAQESKKRAGTENLPGIVGFGKAAELAGINQVERIKKLEDMRNYFLSRIQKNLPHIDINGSMEHRLPGNLNLVFNFIEGEALIIFLDSKGIFASTGSACSSSSFAPSHVLEAMGLPLEKAYSSVRFSLGELTTKEDIDYVVGEIVQIVNKLRSFSPFDENHAMESVQRINRKEVLA